MTFQILPYFDHPCRCARCAFNNAIYFEPPPQPSRPGFRGKPREARGIALRSVSRRRGLYCVYAGVTASAREIHRDTDQDKRVAAGGAPRGPEVTSGESNERPAR